MSDGLRVLLFYASEDAAGVEAAYHESSKLLAGTPGLLGNELLRSVHDPVGFVVASLWRDRAAFDEWETGPLHKGQTEPLRPFLDTRVARPVGIYEVVAQY